MFFEDVEKYLSVHHRKKRWLRLFTFLAAIVVFCTTYALILPAITMEKSGCEIPEHVHTEACYTQVSTVSKTRLVCPLEVHEHTQGCYDESGSLVCGYAGLVVHQHDSSCYDEEGNLWCQLPELGTHTHTESCYAVPETADAPVHVHTEECYTRQRGELICTQAVTEGHTHSEDCYSETRELVCQTPESDGHQHTEACFEPIAAPAAGDEETSAENSSLVCSLEESSGHKHDENCYTTSMALTCGLEETPGHQHTDECYAWEDVLTCQLSTEPAEETEPAAPVLVCGSQEIILHTHTAACLDGSGKPVCGKPQVLAHQHSADCFQTVEEPADTETLTCTNTDESHSHSALCYGSWELSCGLEEHVHTMECSADPTADVETAQEWEQSFAEVRLTGEWPVDVLAIAKTQLGYAESEKNYVVGEDGVCRGYSRYGDWFGCPYGDWCAMFASFCIHYADVEGMPLDMSCPSWIEELRALGLYRPARSEDPQQQYTPSAGDLVFYDWEQDGIADHVGLVAEVTPAAEAEAAKLITLEGNVEDRVQYMGYALDNPVVLGFGRLPEQSFFCGKTGHAHTAACGGEGVCPLEEHIHSEPCLTENSSAELSDQQLAATVYTDSTYSTLCTDNDIVITVSGLLPEGAQVRAYPVQPDHAELAEVSVLCAYDITVFTAEGQVFRPAEDAPLMVTFNMPQELAAKETIREDGSHLLCETVVVGAAHISDDGELEQLEAKVADNNVSVAADHFSTFVVYQTTEQSEILPGESIEDDSAYRALVESGYFTYWEQFLGVEDNLAQTMRMRSYAVEGASDSAASSTQIVSQGGTANSKYNDDVSVSKTIAGTDIENVFDITLQVNTSTNISEFYMEPDVAVVIVMDISNTMKDNFGGITRYEAAMASAEMFIDKLAGVSNGVSKVGFVAFNTDAHEIFGLSPCSNSTQATSLKNSMRQKSGAIINAAGYNEAHNRFTNIEAGLKRGYDMLATATNQNKFIIFLSDGFPTTYIKSGYTGYDPYMSGNIYSSSDGYTDNYLKNAANINKPEVFCDRADKSNTYFRNGKYCLYGTSYSDRAAEKAREMAASIKAQGINIFSIGLAIGDQTIQKYDTHRSSSETFSVIQRNSFGPYEIGSDSDRTAFKQWLGNSIGSGYDKYYFDSDDQTGLENAYREIFAKIRETHEQGSSAQWVANDPMGTIPAENIEFIGFYDKDGRFVQNYGALAGEWANGAENTASVNANHDEISWDLKTSGYTTTQNGDTTIYHYSITYRVRLENELDNFFEDSNYNTNNTTTLTYQTFALVDGNITFSEQRTIDFPIPAVKGYLCDLTFTKVGVSGNPLKSAEFTLTHDTEQCIHCRGDGSPVSVVPKTAVSDENGLVSFTDIPSGHIYLLEETVTPPGYMVSLDAYTVTVAYDEITVTVTHSDGTKGEWKGTIVNETSYELPETGGAGTTLHTTGGLALIFCAAILLYIHTKRRKEDSPSS